MRFDDKPNLKLANQWQPQRAYLWEVWLPIMGYGLVDQVSAKCLEVNFGLMKLTNLRTKRYGNRSARYAGTRDIDPITLTILETEDFSSYSYFMNWHNKIVTNEYYSPRKDYAKSIRIVLYKKDKSESMSFELMNCFPITMPTYNLTYSSSGVVSYNIQLNVDYVKDKTFNLTNPQALLSAIMQDPLAAFNTAKSLTSSF